MNLVIKNRNIFKISLGNFISSFGSYIQIFALSLYTFKITGTGSTFAKVLALSFIPKIIFEPIGGVIADTFDKKKNLVILDIISGSLLFLFMFVMNNRVLDIFQIYAISLAISTVSALYTPISLSIIPELVNEDELVSANSIQSFISGGVQLIVPLLGSILFMNYGIYIIMIINGVSFFIAALFESTLTYKKANKRNTYSIFKNFNEGFIYIKKDKLLIIIILCTAGVNFAFSPIISVGILFISKSVLQMNDFYYSIMEVFFVSGTLLGPLLAVKYTGKNEIFNVFSKSTKHLSYSLAAMGSILFGCIHLHILSNEITYIFLCIHLLVIGIIAIIFNITIMTLLQQYLQCEFLGRILSISVSIISISIPTGQILFGNLFDQVSSAYVVIFAALIVMFFNRIFKIFGNKYIVENYDR